MRKFIIVIVLIFFSFAGYSQNSVQGIWSSLQYPNMDNTIEYELSWGKINVTGQFNIIIDLHSTPPTIIINNFSTDEITSIFEKDEVAELTFHFARGNFSVTMICHFNDDGTMWIEPLPDGLTFFRTGRDYVYYKIDN